MSEDEADNSTRLCSNCGSQMDSSICDACSKCGNVVCSSCISQVPNVGYWDEVSYKYSEVGLARLCNSCYEGTRDELRQRWEREYYDPDRYYNENPY